VSIDSFILAVITTNTSKITGGTPIFPCETVEEMHSIASNLEYILDGIAHQLSDELFIIVKH
jgi:hypothetical protein